MYRELDEYENAQRDLDLAITVDKDDALLVEEVEALRQQQRSSIQTEKVIAKNIISHEAFYLEMAQGNVTQTHTLQLVDGSLLLFRSGETVLVIRQ